MTSSHDWDLISGDALRRSLTKRKNRFETKTISKTPRDEMNRRREELEAEGWTFDRTLTRTIRMKKPKPIGESLEDFVWSLFAKMGFDEMSNGRHFTIPALESEHPQIDVFAKDELSAIVVECKEKEERGRDSTVIHDALGKLDGYRQYIGPAIREKYGVSPPPFVGYVLATRNHIWTETNLARARERGIAVLREEELSYFDDLSDLLGSPARFQLMGELFRGRSIPRMQNVRVPAIKGRYRNTNYYQFAIDAETLARICFVQHKAHVERDGHSGYQRLIKKPKLRAISNYINEGKVFPTNLILNFNDNADVRFDRTSLDSQGSGNLELGILHMPSTMKSAFILDGQHRLFGYFHPDTEPRFQERQDLQVLAYENIGYEDERDIFVDINQNQTSIPRRLLTEIEAERDLNSDEKVRQKSAMASASILQLNDDYDSPMHQSIQTETTGSQGFVALQQLVNALRNSNLIGKADSSSNILHPGSLYDESSREASETVRRVSQTLMIFFNIFREGAREHWDLENTRNIPTRTGGHLFTSPGLASLILLLDDLLDERIRNHHLAPALLSPEELIARVSHYCDPILRFFQNPTYDQIRRFRSERGSGAARKLMHEMQIIIKEEIPDFIRPGMHEYLEERRLEQINLYQATMNEILKDLTDVSLSYLKGKFGIQQEGWFNDGLPVTVRNAMNETYTDQSGSNPNLSIEDCFFMPTHAKSIFEQSNCRDDFQRLFQENDMGWLSELIDIRNALFHQRPEIKDEWASFFRDEVQPKLLNAKAEIGMEDTDEENETE